MYDFLFQVVEIFLDFGIIATPQIYFKNGERIGKFFRVFISWS